MIAKRLTEIEWLEKCPISMISKDREICLKSKVSYIMYPLVYDPRRL